MPVSGCNIQKPAPGVPESIAAFEKNAAALKARLAKVDDAKWDSPARLKMDGKVMWEATARRHAVRFPPGRRAPPRSAFQLPAADGRKGAVDLSPVGRRSRHVNSTSSSGKEFRGGTLEPLRGGGDVTPTTTRLLL